MYSSVICFAKTAKNILLPTPGKQMNIYIIPIISDIMYIIVPFLMKISEQSYFSVPRQNRFAISNILVTQETQII